MPSEPEPPGAGLGLRERKKVRTRSAIQHHALRLFREQGYEATTVSQIAEAAEVSESTFFRYFPTKEAVVFSDDFDDALVDALGGQPAGLSAVEAIRRAVRETFADITEVEQADTLARTELFFEVPELREALAGELVESTVRLADLVAARTGRSRDDLEVRVLAGAVMGAMLAVVLPEPGGVLATDWVERIDRALAHLATGFQL